METCPRCGATLHREDNRETKSLWRVDGHDVATSCRIQTTELALAFCPTCLFHEVIDFQQEESNRRLHVPVCFN